MLTPILAALALQVSLPSVTPHSALVISLAHGSAVEQRGKDQLARLATTYDLRPWYFTDSLVIDQDAVPHSHPILTLHTRHLRDDDLLLSVFLHEEFHWYLSSRHATADSASHELEALFPTIPTAFPEGSGDAESNYTHLLVITLEYQAARQLLGELRARQVMEFWAGDHYTWLYRAILDQRRTVEAVMKKYALASPGFRYR